MGGVTIGQNSVIGAGSVITKDIPENVIAAGVPCKVIREITDKDKTGFLPKRLSLFGEIYCKVEMNTASYE